MQEKYSETELRGLLAALCDEQIESEEYARLEYLLRDDPAARQFYYDYMALHAELSWSNAAGESEKTLLSIEVNSEDATTAKEIRGDTSPLLGFLTDCFEPVFGDFSSHKGLLGIILLVTTAVGLLGFAFLGPWYRNGEVAQRRPDQDSLPFARIVKTADCTWPEGVTPLEVDSRLGFGENVKLQSGLVKIAFDGRAEVILEGPAEFCIESPMSARLVSGRLSATVTDKGHGFTIYGPSMRVLDLGTEFGLCVNEEGKGQVHVFKGEVDVALTRQDGRTVRSQLLTQHKAAAVDSSSGQMVDMRIDPAEFIRTFDASDLDITREYVQTIKTLRPIAYWRFEYFDEGRVLNEMSDRYHGHSPTQLVLSPDTQNKTLAVDQRRDDRQYMTVAEPFTELVNSDMSMEFWIKPDEPQWTTPVMLFYPIPALGAPEPVARLVEFLPAGRPHHAQKSNLIRLLNRLPATWNFADGTNVYSPIEYQPGKWHHIVGTYSDSMMRLFLNGQEVASAPIEGRLDKPPLISIGRPHGCIDPEFCITDKEMVGQIDEVAIYNRVLLPEQVAEHYRLGKQTTKNLSDKR